MSMALQRLIFKLRSEQFCMYEVLDSGRVPESVIGVLLCDYVEQLQVTLRRAGKPMHVKGMEAIQTKRAWLAGKATNVELGRRRAMVQHQMALDHADEGLFFAWAATFASSEKALCAILEGLRRRADVLPIEFDAELRWLGRRLATLLEEHLANVSNSWLPLLECPAGFPSLAFHN